MKNHKPHKLYGTKASILYKRNKRTNKRNLFWISTPQKRVLIVFKCLPVKAQIHANITFELPTNFQLWYLVIKAFLDVNVTWSWYPLYMDSLKREQNWFFGTNSSEDFWSYWDVDVSPSLTVGCSSRKHDFYFKNLTKKYVLRFSKSFPMNILMSSETKQIEIQSFLGKIKLSFVLEFVLENKVLNLYIFIHNFNRWVCITL